MKVITLIFVIVALALAGPGSDQKEFPLAMGKQLTVDLKMGGAIDIRGWDKEIVAIDQSIDDWHEQGYTLEVKETSRGLTLIVDYTGPDRRHSYSADLKLMAPNKCDIDVETMGGEIELRDIQGRFNGQTMGGEINLIRLRGEVDMTTMGGDIEVHESTLEGEVKTMGGTVRLEDVSGGLNGSSMGGDVIYRNSRTGGGKSAVTRRVDISTMGGDINVDDAPLGAKVSTMGGEIRIRNAAKFVDASTMGGDIRIDKVDGGVDAGTMGGDVYVMMVGNPSSGERDVDISSKGGDIELILPDGFSGDFDVRLYLDRSKFNRYKIESDFKLVIEEKEGRRFWSSSPMILGSGQTGDGKYKVKIETHNGNITIRKGSK